ncbi:MAG: MFS transporter [Anaerolineae bacterium]|nr:MFS transporter [Anaerolineae bacterium]
MSRSSWLQQQTQRITWPDTANGPVVGHALRLFWWNGLLDNLSEAFAASYLPLFALSYGATSSQIGFLSSAGNLLAVAGLWPGSRLAERWPRRKPLVMLSGSAARLMLLVLALLPFLFHAPHIVWIIIACAALRVFFNNFGLPAWTAFTARLVPEATRGRYFGSRNFGMRLATLFGYPLAGWLIGWAGAPQGYQLSLGLAGSIGLLSTVLFFGHIPEPPLTADEQRASGEPWALLPALRAQPLFSAFCLAALAWNLSVQLAGPFFNVFLVSELGGTTATVGWLLALFSLSSMVGQRLFGRLSDRRGSLWAMQLTGLLIPLFPWVWAMAHTPWHIVPLYAVSGLIWARYEIGSFNTLLSLTPEAHRPRFVAFYQTLVFVAGFVSPLLGGFLVEALGFRLVFVLSGVGRLLSTLLLIRLVRPPAAQHAAA